MGLFIPNFLLSRYVITKHCILWNLFDLYFTFKKNLKGTNPDVDYLSREDYITVSTKKYPVFCYNRDQIYDLFEHYEKLKSRNGDYDSIDR